MTRTPTQEGRTSPPRHPARAKSAALRRWRAATVAFLLAAFLPAGTSRGQTETPAGPGGPPPGRFLEIEAVRSASRYEQRVTGAPASVSIVTAEEIRRFGYRTLAEVLAAQRGFYTTYDRDHTYLGVRGSSDLPDAASRVLVLIDGHRVNDDLLGAAGVGPEQILDLELVDRIEIVRGPGSPLYGTGACLAIVNILTRRAADLARRTLAVGGAGYGTVHGLAALARELEGGGEVAVSVSRAASDGQDLFFEEFGATARGVDGEDFGRAFARLRLGNLHVQAAYNRRDKTVPTAPFQSLFGSPRNDSRVARGFLDVRYDRRLGSRLEILGRLYYDTSSRRRRYDYGETVTERLDAHWLGLELQASFKPVDRHRLTVGGEFRDHPRQAIRVDDPAAPPPSSSRVEARDFALFVQDDIRASRALTLSLGLRYDHHDSFGGTASPRAAVLFHPSERTVLKAIHAEGFRAPSAVELSLGADADPGLEPERIREQSLVFERYVRGGLLITGTLFRYQIRDRIGRGGAPVLENLPLIESHGVETEFQKRWPKGPTLRVGWAYQETRDAGDLEPLNAPRHLGKAHAGLPLLDGRLVLGAELLYTGRRVLVDGTRTGGHLLTNLTLTAPDLAPGLDLSASLLNLLDEDYVDPAAPHHDPLLAIPQNGRNARARLVWRF